MCRRLHWRRLRVEIDRPAFAFTMTVAPETAIRQRIDRARGAASVDRIDWRNVMKRHMRVGILSAVAFAAFSGSLAAAPVVLRASHQFPGGKGDVRDEMVQIIA